MGDMWWIALGALFVSVMLQYSIIKFSHKFNLFIDSHTDEKPQNFHKSATPRAGGLGIILSMLFLLMIPFGWKMLISFWLAFLSGIFEDFHHSVKPKVRLFLQLIAASFVVVLGDVVVTYLGFDCTMSYDIGMLFSIFAIVGLMNAINIIDGFNGLASGILMLMLLSFGIVAYQVGDSAILHIVTITLASVFGFFLFNFPRGEIFLGDGGAYLLGFVVATIGITLAGHHEKVSPWFVLTVLIYPVWEVLFSIMRKLKAGKSPMEPDSLHLHMLIYRHISRSNPITSVVIVVWSAPFMLLPTLYANNSIANFETSLLYILFYISTYYYLLSKENKLQN